MKFSQKRGCGCCRVTVEPPSPAALRRWLVAPDGPRVTIQSNEATIISEVSEAGRARREGRISLSFVSTFFDIDVY